MSSNEESQNPSTILEIKNQESEIQNTKYKSRFNNSEHN